MTVAHFMRRETIAKKARKAWAELGIEIPRNAVEYFDKECIGEVGEALDYQVTNLKFGDREYRDPATIFIKYAFKTKKRGELVGIVRDTHIDGLTYETSIKTVDGGSSVLRVLVHNDQGFIPRRTFTMTLGQTDDDIAVIRENCPDLRPYIPESGMLDVKGSMARMAIDFWAHPLPLQLK